MRRALLAAALAAMAAVPSAAATLLDAEGERPAVPEWTAEEASKDLSARMLWRTAESSHHAIRLCAPEAPHVHDAHDLTVFLLEGRARVTVGPHTASLSPGDVVRIPRGTPHHAACLDGSCEVYAVFTPPMDAPDMRPVEPIKNV